MTFEDFVARWTDSSGAERANKDAFLLDLCRVLDVAPPHPTTGDPERDTYVFEKDVAIPLEDGKKTIGRIDLYKHGFFLLEAKQGSEAFSKKLGTARRGTASWNIAMQDAYGQALGYARTLGTPPPLLIICDIGFCFCGCERSRSFEADFLAERHWVHTLTGATLWRDHGNSSLSICSG